MSTMQTVDLLPEEIWLEDELGWTAPPAGDRSWTRVAQSTRSAPARGDDGVPLKQLLRWADDGGALPR